MKAHQASGFGTPLFLFKMLRENDPVPARRYLVLLGYLLKSLVMTPASLAEKLFHSKKIRDYSIPETPVFIIGHYRSGTTFLHKVLSADRQWTHLTTFDFLFPYLPQFLEKPIQFFLNLVIRIFKIQHPHFNNYRVNLRDPLEEDMITISSLTRHSAFWGEVFPKKAKHYFSQQIFFRNEQEKEAWKVGYLYLLKKFHCRKKGMLLLKNPPNTGRVRAILELFPDARFIFIYRNPYQVYYSTQRLWKKTLEKHYALQRITETERDEIISWLYIQLMQQYEQDRELIPDGNLVEVRYETFKKNPVAESERIYRVLDLPGFGQAREKIIQQVENEKSYQTYHYDYDDKVQEKVTRQWGHFISKWNYSRLK